MLFGGALVVAVALQLAGVGRLASARGRSVVVWILLNLIAGGVGLRVGLYVAERAADALDGASSDHNFLGLLGTLAPLPLTLGGMFVVMAVLYKLPTHVAARRAWKVSSATKGGEGTLVLERDAIILSWEGRTDTIERAQLRSAVADGESVRLTWTGGEAQLIPMMAPQTRDGRIRQSELLAKLLGPHAPASS